MQAMLSAFASNRRDDWDLWLDSVTFAYNTSRHDALGISPYEVVFGQLPRLPVDLELGMPLTNSSTQSEYLVSVRSAFKDVRRRGRNICQKHPKSRHGSINRQTLGGLSKRVKQSC